MAIATSAPVGDLDRSRSVSGGLSDGLVPSGSAVSWGAVLAGAAAAAALSLILLILGVGLGLSSVSPWAGDGVGAKAIGVSTIVWLTLTQLIASGTGGYLAGRLRTRWIGVHSDEVFFRDSAHGFLSWAVSSLATAALLTSVIGSIVSGGAQAGATLVGGVASTASAAAGGAANLAGMAQGSDAGPMRYFVDALFRRDPSAPATAAGTDEPGKAGPGADDRMSGQDLAQVSRIFMNAGSADPMPPEDLRYVGQIVAQRTGLSQQDAEKRVTEAYGKAQAKMRAATDAAREATDQARKASAYSALWLFVSLLVGGFVASLAATFGGRRRDV